MINNLFDEIYVLHCVDVPERKEHVIKQLQKMDIHNYKIWETCVCKSINYILAKNFESLFTDYYKGFKNDIVFANVFDVAYNFYKIIKVAYIKGYNHILLIEDDINFTIDKNTFDEYIRQIPNDYDILKFSWIASYPLDYVNIENYIKKNNNALYVKYKNEFNLHYNGMFALSRNGMKYFIDYMEAKFSPADIPFYTIGDEKLNYYMTNKSLVYDDTDKTIIGDIK